MVEEITGQSHRPVGPGRLALMLPVVLVLWGFVGVYLLQLAIDDTRRQGVQERLIEELAYFPSGRFLRQAAVEYQAVAADFVWLRAIQYYGHHLMTDRKYEWLGHVFEILTTLDERFIGAYHFGAMTLAWDASEPNQAVKMLVDGMKANPMAWQLPFDAGFICYMQLEDYEAASEFFRIASKLPDAWVVAERWAAVSMTKAGRADIARQMWLDIYHGTENRALRALVLRQLRHLKLEEGLARLQQAVDQFQEAKGRLPVSLGELVRAGFIEKIPEEPYGGRFFLDGGQVRTTTPPTRRE
ncbi:MAG: hypothetical protein ABIL25_07010 [candidate division WOR-3 bacterium]